MSIFVLILQHPSALLALNGVEYLVRASKDRKGEGGIVFNLTRLNEMFFGENQNVIGVIFIARNSSYKKLDPQRSAPLETLL